jgi:alginate O-acetyltransferase complex protein AlgJ
MNRRRLETETKEANSDTIPTAVTPSTAALLVTLFLAMVFAVPVGQYLNEAPPSSGSAVDLSPPTTDGPREGWFFPRLQEYVPSASQIKAYETTLEGKSILRTWLLPPVQAFLSVLGSGSQDVYPGSRGWLFYAPDVEYLTAPGFLDLRSRVAHPDAPSPIATIHDFKEQLAERQVELLIVPTPVKPMLYPEMLVPGFNHRRSLLHNPSFDRFVAAMRRAGVHVLDPGHVLLDAKNRGEQVYLAKDTHWTATGVELTAQAIAEIVRRIVPDRTSPQTLCTHGPVQVDNVGDTARMLYPHNAEDAQAMEQVTVRRIFDMTGEPWSPTRDSDILFLGDSFSNIYSLEGMGWGVAAGLVEQLSYELQRPIDSIVLNGNGAFAARQQLSRDLRRGVDRLSGKRLVIYQFAVRELANGDWRRLSLDVPQPEGLGDKAHGDARRVTGLIAAVARIPRPGSVPYPNLVVAIHLSDVRSDPPSSAEADIVVFLWGIREGKLTATADYRAGQVISLDLVPWDSVSERYGRYNRAELDSEALWDLDVYWAQIGP